MTRYNSYEIVPTEEAQNAPSNKCNDSDSIRDCGNLFAKIFSGCIFVSIIVLYKVSNYERETQMNIVIDDMNDYQSRSIATSGNVSTESNSAKYFVDTQQCRIPYVNPFTPELLKIYKPPKPEICDKNGALIKPIYDLNARQYRLHINESVRSKFVSSGDDVTCCYREIERAGNVDDADNKYKLLSCRNFHQDFMVPTHVDGLIVECKSLITKKLLQQDAFPFVQYKPQNASDIYRNQKDRKPSVFLIGIDSLSRINFRRTMPKTFAHLDENGWFELKGYNKMGDNTFPNLMALLTGLDKKMAMSRCQPNKIGGLNSCDFVWKLYKENGYRTAYAEDEAGISTFNYQKKGFRYPPTDYYLRSFVLAIEKTLSIKKKFLLPFCVGRRQYGEYIYDYALEFAQRYSEDPTFGLFWTNSFSHNSFDAPVLMDEKMVDYLLDFKRNSILDTSIVIFFSDHGVRWGPLLKLAEGFLEERLPMFFIWLPDWFQNQYPEFVKALRVNRHRLSSPYDIYMTLRHIISLYNNTASTHPPIACPKCHSIFYELPENRTCADAGISEHWCTCQPYQTLDQKEETIKKVTSLIISEMNSYLVRKNFTSLCKNITIKSIDLSEEKVESSKVNPKINTSTDESVYRITFTVLQNSAKFQATVLYQHASDKVNLDVETQISRLNLYANDSKCIQDKEAKKYCICIK